MKINEDLQLPSLNKSILNAITDATEIDSIGNNSNGYYMKFKNGIMIQWGNQSKETQLLQQAGGVLLIVLATKN